MLNAYNVFIQGLKETRSTKLKMKKIIIETVSPSGSWSSNFSSEKLDKAYMEYMKLCDIIPGRQLNNKFIIIPSYKSINTLICLYFVDKHESLNIEEFSSKLEKYLQDPRKYDANLKLVHLKTLDDESAIVEDDALTNEEALTTEEKQKNEQVYEETGYEIIGRSPRKSSVNSVGPNPKYIKRGSFSNVVTGIDTTDSEVEKKLVYLMNDEYFCNFKELENLKSFNLFFFETPNSKVDNSTQINKKIIETLKNSHIEYSFTSEL